MKSQDYRIELQEDVYRITQFLEEKIYEHNSHSIGKHDGNLFAITVKDDHENIIAGVSGWTWAGSCEISNLWVTENERKTGLGKKLLNAAEEEAKNRGCSTILVRSYSFQAPYFYVKHGFTVNHVIDNFPTGHNYFFLTKNIH